MTAPRLGILGGGQLGRLLALAARGLGMRVAVLDPNADAPALQIADDRIIGSVDDSAAALRLAELSDVVTLEWELIPARVLRDVAAAKPLRPGPEVLATIQDRLVQKEFLGSRGFPQAVYGRADSVADLPDRPVVVKRRTHGYDGKGQARARPGSPPPADLFTAPCVWEELVPFEKEISVILARGLDGRVSFFPIAENLHRDGILCATRAPALITPEVAERARDLAGRVIVALGHVGVAAVEMFLLDDGRLLINEIAPRVHNSGHFTLEACRTSQFEQHVRAVCGLPLGDPTSLGPATMVNLLGDLWTKGEPRWNTLSQVPGLTLHLYGKSAARPGRKMGHYTVVGQAADEEWRNVDRRLAALPLVS